MPKPTTGVAGMTFDRARPLRVLHVQASRGGGSATGLHDLLRVVDRERFESIVLVYEEGRQAEAFRATGARVVVLENGSAPLHGRVQQRDGGGGSLLFRRSRLLRKDLPLARRLLGVIRREAVELVHHNNNPAGNRPSILAARWAGVPQISHVRFMPHYRWVDRLAARYVDRFLFMSNAVRTHCHEGIGRPAARGNLFYDPFDFAKADMAAAAGVGIRAELGLAEDDRLIVNVGRLVPWKGQDVFLRALPETVRVHPRVKVLIVGEPGPRPSSRTYADSLQQLVEELGLRDHVLFTGYRADVAAIMAAAEVVVHSSTTPEPFGRVIVEAMAVSRPVVATAGGGVLDIIVDGETGLLVPLGDSAAMAAAIRSLLDDPNRARSIGERARRSAEPRFSFERAGAALRDVYERVLASRAARPGLRAAFLH